MNSVKVGLEIVLVFLRPALFWAAVVIALICLIDWLVRTRRLNPFGPIARFFRSAVDPLLAPVERRVVRAGGLPSHAPWWALAVVVVGGIVLLYLFEYLLAMLGGLAIASTQGPGGMARIVISWTFAVLELALLVRVVASWVRISPYSIWVRWSYRLTEWFLRPLRRVVPPIGMMDITPLIAYFALSLLSRAIVGIIPVGA